MLWYPFHLSLLCFQIYNHFPPLTSSYSPYSPWMRTLMFYSQAVVSGHTSAKLNTSSIIVLLHSFSFNSLTIFLLLQVLTHIFVLFNAFLVLTSISTSVLLLSIITTLPQKLHSSTLLICSTPIVIWTVFVPITAKISILLLLLLKFCPVPWLGSFWLHIMGQERGVVTPPPRPHIHSSHWRYCCSLRQLALTHHSLQVTKFSSSLAIQGAGILPVQPGVLCRTALSVSYSKLPTPANLSGLQKHPHGQHQKTPNLTPHQCTFPETAIGTPARSARGFPSLSLALSLNLCVVLPSPAQPGNLSNLPNQGLQSPPGNFRLPHMYDKFCQSRAVSVVSEGISGH